MPEPYIMHVKRRLQITKDKKTELKFQLPQIDSSFAVLTQLS